MFDKDRTRDYVLQGQYQKGCTLYMYDKDSTRKDV